MLSQGFIKQFTHGRFSSTSISANDADITVNITIAVVIEFDFIILF
jgi:hypothetical protein